MNTTITKEGDAFYTISNIISQGHTNGAGQRLVAADTINFPFRREGDPDGINLDPVDVLSILSMHFGPDTAAGKLMADAVEILRGDVLEPQEKHVGLEVPRLAPKRKAGRPAKKTLTKEAA